LVIQTSAPSVTRLTDEAPTVDEAITPRMHLYT
jgi:hypothetical protein